MRDSLECDDARVYLARGVRNTLAKLSPSRRQALRDGFRRVGRQLLESAVRVDVDIAWADHTWPRRRYPQQCYARTVNYVFDHPERDGLRLVHGVVSHAPLFDPLDHSWVELGGGVVFDGVVQAFFTRASYYNVMAAVPMDAYACLETRRLVATNGHPGPWNASWVPTTAQLDAYAVAVRKPRQAGATLALVHGGGGKGCPP